MEKGGLAQALRQVGVSRGTPIGFADEMRVGLRGTTRRVWGVRGVKVRQRVQLAYKWAYLFLMVDGLSGLLSWTWLESMKGEEMASALRELRQGSDVGAVVWDGARGHHSDSVREVGTPTIVLPPYSPELNPAERVFEEIRRWVEGKVYGSIEDKVGAVDVFLRKLRAEPERVRSLAHWAWIENAVQDTPAHFMPQ